MITAGEWLILIWMLAMLGILGYAFYEIVTWAEKKWVIPRIDRKLAERSGVTIEEIREARKRLNRT